MPGLLMVLSLSTVVAAGLPSTPPSVNLRLCVSGQPLTAQGVGVFQQRVMDAAANLPLQIDPYVAPRMRCMMETQRGVADALIGVFTPERRDWLVYPMRNGRPNADLSVGSIQVRVYRRVGASVDWDGQSFSGLEGQALGLKYGSSYGAGLAQLGVALDDRAISNEQLITKLLRGRVAAILLTDEAQADVAKIAPGQIEAVPRIYSSMLLYLVFTKDFERRNPAVVQQLWSNLRSR